MQDSTVTITITAVDGATKVFKGVGDEAVKQANKAAAAWAKANEISNISIKSSGQVATAAKKAAKAQDDLSKATKRSYFAQTALTTVLSAGINKAFLEMVDITGQAIKRVDLLAQFPAAMSALGLSASDASLSLSKLADYTGSIGGNLQDATTSVARFAEVTGNVKAATVEFVAVNNALIAGGAGAQVQANALEQLIQAYSRGVPQLIEWRSLMVAMPAQLNAVARAMDFRNAQELGEALTNGKVSMQSFMTQLSKLATGNGSILTQAEARMNGIEFAFNRFKNTMVAGMTAVVQTIGRQNIIDFFTFLAGIMQVLAQYAINLVSVLFTLFNILSAIFGGPQLQLAKDNTADIADNLGGAAGGAGELADNLGDAEKAAKKTAAGLAAFDKMNVLAPPSAGKDKTSAGGTGGLSPEDAKALEKIFDELNYKIGEASAAAKFWASVLAGIAGIKIAKNIIDQIDGMRKRIDALGKSSDGTKNKLGLLFDNISSRMPIVITDFGKWAKSAGEWLKQLPIITKGVLLFAAAVVALYVSNEDFRKGFDSVWAPILDTITEITNAISVGLYNAFADILTQLGILTPKIEGLDDIDMEKLGEALGGLSAIIGTVLVGKIVVATIHFAFLQAQGIWAATTTAIAWTSTGISVAISTAAAAAGGVADFLALALAGAKSAIATAVAWIKQMARVVAVIVTSVATGIFQYASLAIASAVSAAKAGAAWVLQAGKMIAAWSIAIGAYVIQTTFAAAKTLAAGIIMGVGWLIGLGPLGLVILAIVALLAVITAVIMNFEKIKEVAKVVFQNVTKFVGEAWQNILKFFKGVGKVLGDAVAWAFKFVINGMISFLEGKINFIVGVINGAIKLVDDLIPGGDTLPRVPKVSIPRLAEGGIVKQSTIANIGENGDEAIVPLENNTEWIDKLASKINGASGNGQPVQIVVQVGEDKIVSKVIDLINEKTQMSGRNTILV